MNNWLDNLGFDLEKIKSLFVYNPNEPMIFNSGFFMFLFFAFVIAYTALKKRTTPRLIFVTLFSYYFYYKSSGFYFFLLGIVTVSDFLLAQWIARTTKKYLRRIFLATSVCIGLGLLAYFKYFNFFGTAFAEMVNGNFQPSDIFLPVGISFFTFQSLSYTIDVYRRNVEPLNNILDYAFFVSFFPQLVAGPIVRARDFIPQIRQPLKITGEMIGTGIYFIMCGLFKKAIISDYIGVNFVDRIFENPSLYSGIENLFGIYGYGLQIYCDFSGYSDMAIGIALLLGFKFNINFDSPYKSASIQEFWRRWHISLSSWLRDYLYISLGGNRKGKIRTYINLFITMLLGGLWHGANWNFIIWGALHGMALAVHKFFGFVFNIGKSKISQPNAWRRRIGVLVTFHFVMFAWIFFRNTSLEDCSTMLSQIFGNFQPQIIWQMLSGYKFVFMFILIGYVLHFLPAKTENYFKNKFVNTSLIFKAVVMIILIYLIIQIKSSDVQPFIYFQF
ncbi:MAG: MBOAT family protein [Prevotellaceae bacterium]|jgi:D-alanyl-lipoteichoic acid acyltransferase DltB (MBOAT superfamily)|nr:MBOAT family protein [Prevotellaceae bacterium]